MSASAVLGRGATQRPTRPACKRSPQRSHGSGKQQKLCATGHTATMTAPQQTTTGAANGQALLDLLHHVASGSIPPSDAMHRIEYLATPSPPPAIAAAPPPTARPEVILGAGKTAAQIVTDLERVAATQGVVLATRVTPEVAEQVQQLLPEVQIKDKARMLVYRSPTVQLEKLPGAVAMIAAGSANEAVVEECRVMLQSLGCYCFTLGQAGVMGMHRMVQNLEAIRAADVVVVVTGADAAMVSVVAGMVDTPVIALPTSAGYGTSFGGLTPLLCSLNSSAPGVTAVNIDSGVGASMAAWRILKNASKFRKAAAAAQN